MLVFAGLLGAAFCLATGAAANALHLTPSFPAYGGEDDFSFRFSLFGLVVLPAFVGIGVWIARSTFAGRRGWGRSVVGAFVGTLVFLVLERLLAPAIEGLPSSRAANVAVTAAFLGWIGFAVLGAILAGRRERA